MVLERVKRQEAHRLSMVSKEVNKRESAETDTIRSIIIFKKATPGVDGRVASQQAS